MQTLTKFGQVSQGTVRGRRVETDCDDLARFFNGAAEEAGAHLFGDDEAVGAVVARHVVVVGVDEWLVWVASRDWRWVKVGCSGLGNRRVASSRCMENLVR